MSYKEGKINNKWVRLIIFIIVAINSGAMILGYKIIPFENEEIVGGLSVVALVISEVWNHWKNNSYTTEAKEADDFLEDLKSAKKDYKK